MKGFVRLHLSPACPAAEVPGSLCPPKANGQGKLAMEAGDLPVAEEQHANLTLWYCLLNSN